MGQSKLTASFFSGYIVRMENGELDVEETCNKFRSELLNYQVERETEATTIGAAVNEVFDEFPGARIHLPALQSLSLQRLNVQPENFKALQTRVAEYVRENSSNERSDGKLFKISKGKGGGVLRWANESLSDDEKAAQNEETDSE